MFIDGYWSIYAYGLLSLSTTMLSESISRFAGVGTYMVQIIIIILIIYINYTDHIKQGSIIFLFKRSPT